MNRSSDAIELRALVDSYAIALDELDSNGLSLLWIDDGTVVVREEGPSSVPSAQFGFPVAAGAIIKHLQSYSRTAHHVTTHRSTVDGDQATGTTYCLAHHIFLGPHEQPLDKILSIRYEDHFRREDAWRFSRREINVLFREIRPVVNLL